MDGMAKALRHILEIIRDSRDDEMPVFDAILEQAALLCHAEASGLQLLNDAGTHVVYVRGWGGNSKWFQPGFEMAMDGPNKVPQAIRTASVINIEDLKDSDLYRQGYEPRVQLVEKEGIRSWLIVPLLQDGKGFGCLTLSRHEVNPFSEDDVALVETFATQAAIAIENVRQFRELQTRLDREGASRHILDVISRSRDDDRPVFDAILENAARLCNAPFGFMGLADETQTHLTVSAHIGARSSFLESDAAQRTPINRELIAGRAVLDKVAIRQDDLADDYLYRQGEPFRVQSVDLEGVRSVIAVPLVGDAESLGILMLYRREVSPFSDDDVALVENFAAQAVIAIENVRQFRELQTRLEREAATREILEVISQSRDDEQPVFDAILENASRLCHAPLAALALISDDGKHYDIAAERGAKPEFMDFIKANPPELDPERYAAARAIVEMRTVYIDDLADPKLYGATDNIRAKSVALEGIRTSFYVPLISGDRAIGALGLYRREVSPFSKDDIALIEGFAAQAVIAIENVRQFHEVQTRLEREAASREILEVISQSRDDERPVLDAITRNAVKLCDAAGAGLWLLNVAGDVTRLVSTVQHPDHMGETVVTPGLEFPREDASLMGRCLRDSCSMNVTDIRDDPFYQDGDPTARKLMDDIGIRSRLIVPLLDNGIAFGCISLIRREVRAFSDAEITLIESFAAQAVIAIENVRQFCEIQERLQRERASAEILRVISQSREDEMPVFEAILDNACSLCDAPLAGLILGTADDATQTLAAHKGMFPEAIELFEVGQMRMDGDLSYAARSIIECRLIAFDDMGESDLYHSGSPVVRSMVDASGIRSVLFVPLIKDGTAIGNLTLFRRDISPFDASEISLVQTFAAQAVIAIQSVRQFREVQTRLEREAASRDILQVISGSRTDPAPVFDVILRNAAQLSGAPLANLCLLNAARSHWHLVAHFGDGLRHLTVGKSATPLDSGLVPAVAIRTAQVIHIEDLTDTDLYRQGDPGRVTMVEVEGMRTIVGVPLLSGTEAIGCITLFRREVKAFSSDEIALVETFAAQAVIAIENVRQFGEVQERLERERASREILQVISKSREDETPTFRVILENAARLCGAIRARLMLTNDENTELCIVATWGEPNPTMPEGMVIDMEQDMIPVRAVRDKKAFNVPDARESRGYKAGNSLSVKTTDESNTRSVLAVPLTKDDEVFGCIAISDPKVGAFNDSDVLLVQTFAAQAVIAIENVRQFRALESKTEEVQALNASLKGRVDEQVGEIERMGRLKRFLPTAVADTVISQGADKMLSSHRALLGVLFCDIRGFTAFCETAEPEETIEVLQTYHQEMGKLIADHGAGVDHRMGDGIMVLFNDPLPCDDPAGDAVRLAIAMQARMENLCSGWKRMGHRLGFGVGISLGYATVGMVGYEGRYDYTASGTAVNLAARLCDRAEDGEILLSPRAQIAVEDTYHSESTGEIRLKGIQNPMEVFRLGGTVDIS